MNLPKPNRGFWSILILALTLRLGLVWLYSTTLGRDGFLMGDSLSYWTLAQQIAHGQPYEYGWEHARCFRMPGFPTLLSPLFMFYQNAPPLWLPRILTAVLGTLSVGLTVILARMTVGQHAAIWAGIGTAIFPELLISSVLVLSEAAFIPLMLGQLIMILMTLRASSAPRCWIGGSVAGALAGLSILVRPSWALALPVIAAILTLSRRTTDSDVGPHKPRADRLYQGSVTAALFTVSFVILLTPWWVRNHRQFGHFVPTTLQTGASLYDGWNETATGSSDMSEIDRIRLQYLKEESRLKLTAERADFWSRQLPDTPSSDDYWPQLKHHVTSLWGEIQRADPTVPPFEFAFDRHLGNLAKEWAISHPGEVARLSWEKILKVWSPVPSSNWSRYPQARWILTLAFVMLAVFSALGAWAGRRRWQDGWILVFPALYFTLLHAVFVGSIRYREPALYGLIILAGVFLASVQNRLSLGKDGR